MGESNKQTPCKHDWTLAPMGFSCTKCGAQSYSDIMPGLADTQDPAGEDGWTHLQDSKEG